MKKIPHLFFLLIAHFQLFSQSDYFFANKKFNSAIASPEQFLGYPVGSHHTRYDKIVDDLRDVARGNLIFGLRSAIFERAKMPGRASTRYFQTAGVSSAGRNILH